MPALYAGSAGIDVQEVERLVIFHLEDMTMPRDEELRRIGKERGAHAVVVVAGIAADMLDEHVDVLTLEAVQFPIHQPQVAAVAVATDGAQGPERRQPLGHLYGADVAGMPYLVAGLEIMQVFLVPVAMCVAQYAYLFHCFTFYWLTAWLFILNFFIYHSKRGMVMAHEPKSLAGIEAHSPSSPHSSGKA